MNSLIRLLALTMLTTLLLASPVVAASEPVRMTFDKSMTDPGVWHGVVSGDVNGGLTTELKSLNVTGHVWQVTFDWIVAAGDQSFIATMSGTLNTTTGAVVMNGTVTTGWLLGARVHESGQLIDATASRFQGQITILPATAPRCSGCGTS